MSYVICLSFADLLHLVQWTLGSLITLFHSFYGQGTFHCVYMPYFFIHSSVDGHLGYFYVLAFVNCARTVLSTKNDHSLSLAKILSRNNFNILILMNTNFKSMSYLISFLDLDGFLISFYWFVGKKNVFIIKGKNTTYFGGTGPYL